MSDKIKFALLVRSVDVDTLASLAQAWDRSKAAVIRKLIRDADRQKLTDKLIDTVDRLLDYRERNSATNFQLEKCDDFINQMRTIRDEMRAHTIDKYG